MTQMGFDKQGWHLTKANQEYELLLLIANRNNVSLDDTELTNVYHEIHNEVIRNKNSTEHMKIKANLFNPYMNVKFIEKPKDFYIHYTEKSLEEVFKQFCLT